MSLADLLAVGAEGSGISYLNAVVTAVTSDGRVNLDASGNLVDGVPCLRGYLNRKKGDVVLVVAQGVQWVVLDAIGSEAALNIPDQTTVRWGTGAPTGSGWVKASGDNVWVRSNEVYIAYAVSDPTPDPAPSSPGARATASPNDDAAYRDGHIDTSEPNPIQGAWPTYPHAYTGAWFYGTEIADWCAGKTVTKMTINLSRAGASAGGIRGAARVRLYLHNYTTAPNGTPTLTSYWSPGTLEPGESDTFTMPSSWRDALASGSARGVGCSAGVGNDYLTYGSCGLITITAS